MLPMIASATCGACNKSVSYTHLDVYKRQIYSCGLGIYSKVWNVIPCGSKFEDSVKEVEEEVDTGADIVKVANTLMDDEGITETLEPPVMDDERLTRHRRTPTKSGESTYASRTLFKNSSNTRSSLTFRNVSNI